MNFFQIAELKADVQKLMNEKLKKFSANEDHLGPFRNQTTIISNKKQNISDNVTELRNLIDQLDANAKEKEILLHNLIGGEVLHGDELKLFISKLREMSVTYKNCRLILQTLTSELGIIGRTLDVLKSIDSNLSVGLTINNVYISELSGESPSTSVNDAKRIIQQYKHAIDTFKANALHLYKEEMTSRKDIEILSKEQEHSKEVTYIIYIIIYYILAFLKKL